MRRPPVLLAALSLAALAGCAASARPGDEALRGHHEGTLLHASAMTAIALDLERGPDSAWAGRLSAPELLVLDQPIDSIDWRPPRLHFTIRDLGARYRFEGFARGGRISGRLLSPETTAGARPDAFPKLSLRRLAPPLRPFLESEVRIESAAGALAGVLRMPADTLPHPAMLLLAGPSPETAADRAALADTLARAGWAALTVEPRSRGTSAGEAATSDDVAQWLSDSEAAFAWLSRQPRVSGPPGVLGLSRDGALAARLAARVPARFVVAVSPAGVSERRLLAWRDSVLGRTREAVQLGFGGGEFDRDPAADWSALRVPALVLHGGRDRELPVEECRRALVRAGGERVSALVFERAGHDLRVRPEPGEPFDWPRFAPGALDSLLAWSRRAAGLPPAPAPPDTGVPRLQLRPGWR